MKYYIQMMCLMGLLLAGCSDAQEDIEQVIGDEGCRVGGYRAGDRRRGLPGLYPGRRVG